MRFSNFGLANSLELFQARIFGLLSLIPNNPAFLRLVTRRWKSVQQLSYLAFASVAGHGPTYQLAQGRDSRITLRFSLIIPAALSIQLLWVIRVSQPQKEAPRLERTIHSDTIRYHDADLHR